MNTQPLQHRYAVSTWSLHRTLGSPPFTGPESPEPSGNANTNLDALPLLALPARLREFGIYKVEICHFHIPTREHMYLQQLRSALEENGITLWQLLIDGGDITHPEHAARDMAWIKGWIDTAATLGATRVRVSGGKSQPSAKTYSRSRGALAELADYAGERNVRLLTENWQTLLATPEAVFAVLDGLDHVGLLADLGNWSGPTKYDDLAQILPRAESCHAKAHFAAPANGASSLADGMDRADYMRSLAICKAANFSGPYSLIYDGPNADEWAGLRAEMAVVAAYL